MLTEIDGHKSMYAFIKVDPGNQAPWVLYLNLEKLVEQGLAFVEPKSMEPPANKWWRSLLWF